jgi:hypothetical protein
MQEYSMENRSIATGIIGFGAGLLISGIKLRSHALANNRDANIRVEEMTIALECCGFLFTMESLVRGLSSERAAGTFGFGCGLTLSAGAIALIPLFVLDDTSPTQIAHCAVLSILMGMGLISHGVLAR